MKKNLWITAAASVLVLGAAGYTIAQSTGGPRGGIMGPGMGMMGSGMMGMMSGQPLNPEQLEQFAKLHGSTVDQAKQMTDACTQIMAGRSTPQTQGQ